jgi:hypothetical protein
LAVGGHPYWYFVPYQKSIQAALDQLREREFLAGRYNPVINLIDFSNPRWAHKRPGAKHKSIEAAFLAAEADGTRSVLDISKVSRVPGLGATTALSSEKLEALYGTQKPTRAQVEPELSFLNDVKRGHCVHFVLHESGAPSEICFAGYSYD